MNGRWPFILVLSKTNETILVTVDHEPVLCARSLIVTESALARMRETVAVIDFTRLEIQRTVRGDLSRLLAVLSAVLLVLTTTIVAVRTSVTSERSSHVNYPSL